MPPSAGTRIDHDELEHLDDDAQAQLHRIDARTGEQVVVKFRYPRSLDDAALAGAWRREASITEALGRPNLHSRPDVGGGHHESYILVGYASGGGLDGWISSGGPRLRPAR